MFRRSLFLLTALACLLCGCESRLEKHWREREEYFAWCNSLPAPMDPYLSLESEPSPEGGNILSVLAQSSDWEQYTEISLQVFGPDDSLVAEKLGRDGELFFRKGPLLDGTYRVESRAKALFKYPKGNGSHWTRSELSSKEIILDSTPPILEIFKAEAVTDSQGVQRGVEISGGALDGMFSHEVEIWVAGMPVQRQSDGRFFALIPYDLLMGQFQVVVRATDWQGLETLQVVDLPKPDIFWEEVVYDIRVDAVTDPDFYPETGLLPPGVEFRRHEDSEVTDIISSDETYKRGWQRIGLVGVSALVVGISLLVLLAYLMKRRLEQAIEEGQQKNQMLAVLLHMVASDQGMTERLLQQYGGADE